MISKTSSSRIIHDLGRAVCALVVLLASTEPTAVAQDKVDFVKDIKPIIESHCISCHGPEKEEAFRIDVKDDAMAYIEAKSAEDSDFYMALISDDEEELMPPPDEGTPLSADQIALVKTWIDEGADWPEDVELVDTSSQDETPVETSDEGTEAGNSDSKSRPKGPDVPTTAEKTQQIFNAIGSLHPAAVHLPIGLLLASGLFALFSLRGNFVMSDCAYYCLWLGTVGAIAACLSGWWFSPMEKRGAVAVFADLLNQEQPVFWHRTGGLVVTAFAFLLALFAAGARARDPDDGVLWKLGLIVLACGIGWVGHTGGELHYPSDHYKDLNGIYERIIGSTGIVDEKPVGKKPDETKDENVNDEKVKDEKAKDVTKDENGKDENADVGKVSDDPETPD